MYGCNEATGLRGVRNKTVVVVQGAKGAEDIPGLAGHGEALELRCASTPEELRAALPGSEVLFGWDFRAGALRDAWSAADRLRWVHWCGAGVDAVLFPELVRSEVVLTNSRGIFDRPMAEYVLGLIIALAKGFPETLARQARGEWAHRMSERLQGRRVLVIGVGSIGREFARVFTAFGLEVEGVGRRGRRDDPDFPVIHPVSELDRHLPGADFVVVVVPLTADTAGLLGAAELALMKPSARLINVARGAVVDETALISALESGQIAGAALDVFESEPLPPQSPIWSMANVIVSPHMSGDFFGYEEALAECFLENFERYRDGRPLRNVVDKVGGFVASPD